ncbi:MAG: class I SAM-dependent methyltransferase, partial [Burkholderiaceae bacterium]
MKNVDSDKVFSGSVPKLYEEYFVPLIFEPYAVDLVNRIAARSPAHVLEIACGTGVVTRKLASALPASTAIVATDLNQPMIDMAIETGTTRSVEWRQADAMQLPFPDASFDVVVCQFGVMFFPEKAKAFSEARRVLRPGGALIFNVWDRIENNEFVHTTSAALAAIFPEDPPRFMERTPHGYYDFNTISADLKSGGFTSRPQIHTVAARSKAPSPQHPAIAYCQGSPLRGEIEARGPTRLSEVT